MPRKNKRKFFFGKSKKSKSAKLENQDVTTELENQQQSDSEEENNNATEKGEREMPKGGNLHKSAVHASISSVTNDSASELGGQIDANSQLSLAEVDAFKMGTATSARWRSEPILSVLEKENRRATITLKIVQFIPKAEASQGGKINSNEDTQNFIDNTRCVNDDDADHHKSTTIEIAEQIQPSSALHVDSDFAVGEVPKLDHTKEEQRRRLFDDNYRVESPRQHQAILQSEENRNKRRHAMLIQEISESSSSEEVKQFLDAEASALEMKSEIIAVPPSKIYRVDSPESSSNDDEVNRCKQSSLVNEICESSSNESVKNEILASLSKQPPTPTPSQVIEPGKLVTLKIINIKELPLDDLPSPSPKTPASPIMKHKPVEKKLNKAEEAIMEALYGNPNLLQIPNTPLDVISEEGSDCSDIERHSKINQLDIDDDEVFLPPSSTVIARSAESSTTSKFKHRRRVMTANSAPPVEQPTMLINTRIIEALSNVPESCKTWETKPGDSELQAELVYLPSTSSSATDLSERSGDITDPEDTTADTSEDTETNSLLENISVPPLYDISNNVNILQQACELYIDSEHNQLPLPDILEESSDDLSQKSLELIESQQQIIEDVNKELHHLVDVSRDEYAEAKKNESMNENKVEVAEKEEGGENKAQNSTQQQQQQHEPNVIAIDKKLTTTDNEPQTRQLSSNSGTPTQFRRKYSSDSSSSSANSQCTIIRQTVPIDSSCVHPLRDLCMQSLQSGIESNNNIINGSGEAKITVQKKFNSISRNAPNIPIINELELHYDDRRSRENQRDKVITILQVPPDIKSSSEMNQTMSERTRWYGMPSTQTPNLMLALSPLQKDYMMNSASSTPDPQQGNTSVDVLLDMHKKFVERRAYHEKSDDENSDTSRLAKVLRQENENRSDDNNNRSSEDVEMKIARDSPQKSSNNNGFEVKRFELENELKLLDIERQELEEELKNLQSLQHFKQEEYIFTQKQLEEDLQSVSKEDATQSQSTEKYANDDFNEFINSNEKLHQEIYNEWQDKVYQRNERKLQKTLKITAVNDQAATSSSSCDADDHSERAASEKYVPLRDEFISKVKERQKRLSLPIDDTRNWDASTESLLDDEQTAIRKKKKKVCHVEGNKENFPAHFREFLDYCEQEIAQSKNSVESGKSMNTLPLLGLIGVASLCICGFFIWKNSSKLSP